jgi:hypothetical protein
MGAGLLYMENSTSSYFHTGNKDDWEDPNTYYLT